MIFAFNTSPYKVAAALRKAGFSAAKRGPRRRISRSGFWATTEWQINDVLTSPSVGVMYCGPGDGSADHRAEEARYFEALKAAGFLVSFTPTLM